ncbi:hypothetical protein U1Q18_023103, partial [Sarracenia purpurea var. burkii]
RYPLARRFWISSSSGVTPVSERIFRTWFSQGGCGFHRSGDRQYCKHRFFLVLKIGGFGVRQPGFKAGAWHPWRRITGTAEKKTVSGGGRGSLARGFRAWNRNQVDCSGSPSILDEGSMEVSWNQRQRILGDEKQRRRRIFRNEQSAWFSTDRSKIEVTRKNPASARQPSDDSRRRQFQPSECKTGLYQIRRTETMCLFTKKKRLLSSVTRVWCCK